MNDPGGRAPKRIISSRGGDAGSTSRMEVKRVAAGQRPIRKLFLWLYPDGSRILELSTKCPPTDMPTVAVDSRLFLRERGVVVTGEQHTKTRTALEYFSQHIPVATQP